MKEIVKVLLAEGIDEEVIHEVLDVISETSSDRKIALLKGRLDQELSSINNLKAAAEDHVHNTTPETSGKVREMATKNKQARRKTDRAAFLISNSQGNLDRDQFNNTYNKGIAEINKAKGRPNKGEPKYVDYYRHGAVSL